MVRSPPFTSSHKCEVVKSFFGFWKGKSSKPSTLFTDLSPCDFFLFPRLKKMLSGNKYTSRSSLGSAIYQCLQQIPKEDYFPAGTWRKYNVASTSMQRHDVASTLYLRHVPAGLSAFRNWVKRLQKCVSVKGEWFEGL